MYKSGGIAVPLKLFPDYVISFKSLQRKHGSSSSETDSETAKSVTQTPSKEKKKKKSKVDSEEEQVSWLFEVVFT